VKALALLADSAQVDDHAKVYALGLGWSHIGSPTPPIAVVCIIDLEQHELPSDLTIQLELRDADGRVVQLPSETPGEERPFILRAVLEAKRNEGIRDEPIMVPGVFQIGPGLALDPGMYSFDLIVGRDLGRDEARASRSFRVRSTPAGGVNLKQAPAEL
jgi:hypothetical protein